MAAHTQVESVGSQRRHFPPYSLIDPFWRELSLVGTLEPMGRNCHAEEDALGAIARRAS